MNLCKNAAPITITSMYRFFGAGNALYSLRHGAYPLTYGGRQEGLDQPESTAVGAYI